MASIQIDSQAKANIDRILALMMRGIRRVEALPERGGLHEWVIVQEKRGEDLLDCTYVWLDGQWTCIGQVGVDAS